MESISAPSSVTARDAYKATADIYDAFTAHHDYELWFDNLLPALLRHGLSGRSLLDVGCGTGKSFLPMLDRGWSVTAVDISPAMASRARAKAAGRARIEVHDMRLLPRLGRFDLVWCLDDAINYLLSRDDLEGCLRGLVRNLGPRGLCAFDVNTLACYRAFFAETQVVPIRAGRLVWRGKARTTTPPGSHVAAWLDLEDQSGRLLRRAVHHQRHFPPREIERALARAGLRHLATYGHGHDARLEQPPDESRHTKLIFIAGRGPRR